MKLMKPLLLCGALALVGCDNSYQVAQQNIAVEMPNKVADENQNFARLAKDYFEQHIALNPIYALYIGDYSHNGEFVNDLTDDYLKQRHDLTTKTLAFLNGLSIEKLSLENQISYQILKGNLQNELQGNAFPSHFLPFSQFDSLMSTMAQLGSGQSAQPFKTAQDYRDFAQRLRGYITWFDSAKQRLAEGVNNKVVLPRVLVKRLLGQLEAQVVKQSQDSIFYQPIIEIGDDIPQSEANAIRKTYESLIADELIPAYQGLIDFINEDYLPHTRATDGYGSLPNGLPWYQYLANTHTTTTMDVAQIHELGLIEVKRILKEMNGIREKVGFDGDLKAFFEHLSNSPQYYFSEKQDLIDGYQEFKKRIDKVLPQYFGVMPKSPYIVKAVEAFREQSAAGASYMPGSPDGTRPGVFYINTYNLKAQPKWGMMTLSLHEAAPGHHFQISLSQELEGVPDFQKFGGQTAFIEGWALYSEYLGIEMGLFEDPYQYFGKLADEMLRAMRLVVDTGLHAKGWSREQAIAYMLANSTMAESDVIAEVERYMALPGQALSYKIGQLKIIELRKRAQDKLGNKFDIKEFHNQVLLDGALPLAVLESKIDRWIATKLAK